MNRVRSRRTDASSPTSQGGVGRASPAASGARARERRVVEPGDQVAEAVEDAHRTGILQLLRREAAGAHRDVLPPVPEYLNVDLEKLSATLVRRPKRDEVPVTCDVQMVVEYYSR